MIAGNSQPWPSRPQPPSNYFPRFLVGLEIVDYAFSNRPKTELTDMTRKQFVKDHIVEITSIAGATVAVLGIILGSMNFMIGGVTD